MSRSEIAEKVAAISEINFEYGTQLDALTISMIEMDEYKFDRIVSANIQQLGFERTMLEVIYPFLDKLSVLWLTGSINPVQENFMSYLIRQKIVVAIDQEPLVSSRDARRFLIYLPEGEKQELSMLFMHYLLKSRGNHVAYVGQEINLPDLKRRYSIYKPDFIFTMITETFTSEPLQQYVDRLAENFKGAQILLSATKVVVQGPEA
jgi:MerR family transcriptional regulator, light-induced transcriptional regulator